MKVLFLKAAIRGGAANDLFAQDVQVAGYTTKDGTFVAPHHATRHKKNAKPAEQADLFASPPESVMRPAPPSKPKAKLKPKQDDLLNPLPTDDRVRREGMHLTVKDPAFGFDVETDQGLKDAFGNRKGMTDAARAALEKEMRARMANPSVREGISTWWTGTGWAVKDGEKIIEENPETKEDWTRHEATLAARQMQKQRKADREADEASKKKTRDDEHDAWLKRTAEANDAAEQRFRDETGLEPWQVSLKDFHDYLGEPEGSDVSAFSIHHRSVMGALVTGEAVPYGIAVEHDLHKGRKNDKSGGLWGFNQEKRAENGQPTGKDQAQPVKPVKKAAAASPPEGWDVWWDKTLTHAGREQAMNAAGIVRGDGSAYPRAILWRHLPGQKHAALQELYRNGWDGDAKPAAKPVPDAIKQRVARALAVLADVEAAIEGGRKGDAMFQGNGRYESEAFENRSKERESALRMLAIFREKAAGLGIDPEETIRQLGGEPKIAMSAAGQAYAAGKKPSGGDEPPEPPKGGGKRPAPVAEWGVAAGVSKADRRGMNAAAAKLLAAKTDEEMTDDDRQVLARYSGQGGVGDSLNEFYTDPAVATAMWDMLKACGFEGGDVLEPSCGTGAFLHTAPAGSRVTGVEMEPTSARIARILHGPAGHEVHGASLERFATQDGREFDAVIGNVPFGLRGSTIRDDKPDLATAEGYFVDTALDKTKAGGLVALIVPTGFMDSARGRAVRERVLRKGEFIAAHRLPNTAFEASHTEVTSDIVMFRRRPPAVAGALSTVSQEQMKELGAWDAEFLGGSYFTEGRGADHIMGRMEEGWRAKAGMGDDITVVGSMKGVPEALAQWKPEPSPMAAKPLTVPAIVDSFGDDEAGKRRALTAAAKPAYQPAKLGDVRVIDGSRYILQGDPPRWHLMEDDGPPAAVRDALPIAEAIEDLAEGRAKDPAYHRADLIEALDSYVAKHGTPSRNKDLRAWISSPSLPKAADTHPDDHPALVAQARNRVARLLGAVAEDGGYSDLVTGRKRIADLADLDTVATKLALEGGSFQPDQLATAAGIPRDRVLDHLFASPGYAVEADGQTWTTMDAYLAGDLWSKLDAVKAAAEHEGLSEAYRARYARQALALEEAINPASLEDVEVQVNSGFVTPEMIRAWLDHRVADYTAKNPNATWVKDVVSKAKFDGALWHVSGGLWGDGELVEKHLNRAGVKKDDLPKLEKLQADFREWLLGSEFRDEAERRYNRTYRGFRPRVYSDSPIAIPGLNPAIDVNAFQWAGIRWAMEAGSGIIAADVGLGKTPRGLMLARLAKTTGQAKKPAFVVPKSVLPNWIKSAEQWFPGARVLVIGETYSRDKAGELKSKADDAETRQRKLHDLAQNDYDFVFISQPAWNEIDLDPIKKGQYANDDFWAKRGDALGNAGDKRLNQIRTAHDQALAKREFGQRENTLHFDALGIDMLLMDEGHAYKNLYAARNRFGENPKFLGGSGLSNRAQDTYFKTRALREATGGKGVFMLTATPTKNSPLEIYSMLSHIAPDAFERMGIKNSEDFLDRFCEFKTDQILGVDGKMEEALVTAGFKNLDELREVMRRYIDRKTAEDVGLKLPARGDKQHTVAMTEEQEAVYQDLRAQAEEASAGDAEGDSHIFSIMDKMQKAALDLELLGPEHAGTASPKMEAMAKNVSTLSAKGGQLVFCDSVQSHEKIAATLVKAGIPRDQIGIINGKATPSGAALKKIEDAFNAGKLKVVIGNTAKMGEGVNLQERTSDIHHLDLPWEPASLQQRNGRGLRQGNTLEAVGIHTYLAKASFDGYRYQTVAAKKDWQDLLWNGGDRVENLARQGGIGRTDMLIMLSANPEEARAKYEADKKAAGERHQAEQRQKAAGTFVRFQEMKASLRKLRAKEGQGGEAADRLEQRVGRLREILHDSEWFTHKDALDSEKPAALEPVTGHLWTEGKGFTLDAGPDSPIKWSDKPTKWVVTEVEPDLKTIRARQYGTLSTAHPLTLTVDEMAKGITPFEHSQEAEEHAIREEAAAIKARAGEAATKRVMEDKTTSDGIRQMPRDMVERLAPALQARLKDTIRAHGDGYRSNYGMIGPDGSAVIAPSWEVRDKVADHDLMLPIADHRQKAIDAYVQAHLSREVVTHVPDTGRRGRGGYNRPAPTTDGVKANYGRLQTSNPWESVISDTFDPEAGHEARREVTRRVAENIAAAPTFQDAIRAAQPSIDVPSYGGQLRAGAYPVWLARALHDKARALGVEDQTVDAATGEEQEVRAWGMPSTAPARKVMKPVVNSGLLKVPVRRSYIVGTRTFTDPAPADTSRTKLGDWLRSMMPAEDAAELAPPTENAA